jgi:hypothetical protein
MRDCVANSVIAAPAAAPSRMNVVLRIIREPFQGFESNFKRKSITT